MAENRSGSQQFSDGSEERQRQRETQADAQTVQCRVEHSVFRGERFGAPQNDAVDDDQRDVNAQCLVQVGHVSLHTELDHRDERCDHDDESRNAYLVRDDVFDHRYDDVRQRQDEQRSRSHAHAVQGRSGRAERRAHAEQQHESRIFPNQTLDQNLQFTHGSFPFDVSTRKHDRRASARRHMPAMRS